VLLSATGLPIIVAVTAIGVESGLLEPTTAAALVGAGMLSVLLFPLVALSQRPRSAPPHKAPAPGAPGAGHGEERRQPET
jgi:hypothetical protein